MMNKVLTLVLCLFWTGSQADIVLPNASPHQSVGTINCASSTCHGAITPWQQSTVLQNEYTTWLRLDRHSTAYNVLLNDKSQRIATSLGLKQPAYQSTICLDCHTHNPPATLRGERYIVSEGVGCEACHGPAEKWLVSHTEKGTNHGDNVANGLYPTEKPVQQVRLCLSCHFGDDSRFVTHRMMAAGHPRLSFEQGTFSALEPPHYNIDVNWHKRKGDYDPLQMWAIGQAVASEQLLNIFANPKQGRDGLFPELVLFDCNACHHRMSEKSYSPRLGLGPGRLHLNDSNLLMMSAIVADIDPSGSGAFNDQIKALHQAISGNENEEDAIILARNLSATIQRYINQLAQQHIGVAELTNILHNLINETSSNNYTDYAGAEQAYMSISSLATILNRQVGLKNVAEINRHLSSMRNVLANEEKFVPETFKKELSALRLAMQLPDHAVEPDGRGIKK